MRKLLVFVSIFNGIYAFSQQPDVVKFGKISAANFERKVYTIDTSAEAVVLSDIGSTQIKGNKKEWFSLEYKQHKRMHILKKSGYTHATIEIPLYKDGELEEQLSDLKAVTYNYENGKVVESKLDVKNAVFKDKLDRNRAVRKFTFPNVREGSIVEYEYKLTSDFLFNLQPWYFQGEIPSLWSEYTVSLPSFLKYMLIAQGNQDFYLRDNVNKQGYYSVEVKRGTDSYGTSFGTDRVNITCGITDFRWAMKDIAALKQEAYTTTVHNYMSKLEFQLAAYLEPLQPQTVMSTWPDLTQRLIKREDFGMEIENAITWLPAVLTGIIQNASTETEKARKIYAFVRDNITCTDYHQIYTEKSLKNVYEKKNGGVAEINLLLTAMFRYAGLTAHPVILSRRQYGFVYAHYPVIGRFNYVISKAVIDGKEMMFDASRSKLGFGKLGYDCYNGTAKMVNETATDLQLTANQVTEKEDIKVTLSGNTKGEWTGQINKIYGYYESETVRDKMGSNDKEALLKDIAKSYDSEVKVENLQVGSLTALEEPVTASYTVSYSTDQADIVYIHPVISGRLKYNPFKSTDRQYPVEMPYKMDESYSITVTIPEGYTVDEMPTPKTIKMNQQGDAVFTYAISKPSATVIKMECRLETNKALFQTSEYEALREFFNMVVAKQDEQIVLKKSK